MLELNKVHKVDVMDGMRQLEDNSIDLIITSPPYNKAGLNGHKKPHPAPFPLEIPNNIIPHVAQGERITILDPFMGSGTVALAAKQNNCDWIGFDLFDEYIQMTNNRIKN